MASDHKLVWTLLILAAAVLGWTLAGDLAGGWVAIILPAAVLILLVPLWFWPARRESEEPPP